MECELCGRAATSKAKVEGTVISVCKSCAEFGELVYEQKAVKILAKPKYKQPEEVYFVNNFASIVKEGRESMSLAREQLAEKIKEKASVIERIEKGARPEKRVAEKLERYLGVKLMTSADAEKIIVQKKSAEPLTLGDVVTVRKRKK